MKKIPHLRNLTASWSGVGLNIIISFLMTPFIVHSLGDVRYGIWSLIISVVGYLGLADIGLRRSITKHINQYLAQENQAKAQQVVSTSLISLFFVSGFILLFSLIIAFYFHQLFSGVSEDYIFEIRVAFFLCAVELAVGLTISVFRRAMESFNRFDIVQFLLIGRLILRTIGVIVVLILHPTLIWLSVVSLASLILMAIALLGATFKIWPELRIRPPYFDRDIFREIIGFGLPTFFDNVSARIINYTDITIIGVLINVETVTIYSISLMMINYSQEFIKKISNIITPSIFKEAALGNNRNVQYLFLKTVNTSAYLCIPVIVGFTIFGTSFVNLWIGPKYREAAVVLSILVMTFFILPLREPAKLILLGYGVPKKVAFVSSFEAAANLGLSIVLVLFSQYGIRGIAIGTVIPAFLSCVVLTIWSCRIIETPVLEFLRKTLLRWILPTIIFSALCFILTSRFNIDSWISFFCLVLFASIFYLPLGFYLIFDKDTRKYFYMMISLRKKAAA